MTVRCWHAGMAGVRPFTLLLLRRKNTFSFVVESSASHISVISWYGRVCQQKFYLFRFPMTPYHHCAGWFVGCVQQKHGN
jgi:hypothetical protein